MSPLPEELERICLIRCAARCQLPGHPTRPGRRMPEAEARFRRRWGTHKPRTSPRLQNNPKPFLTRQYPEHGCCSERKPEKAVPYVPVLLGVSTCAPTAPSLHEACRSRRRRYRTGRRIVGLSPSPKPHQQVALNVPLKIHMNGQPITSAAISPCQARSLKYRASRIRFGQPCRQSRRASMHAS